MSEVLVNAISHQMSSFLNGSQLKRLKAVLRINLLEEPSRHIIDDNNLLKLFLTAKEVEGCSPKTIAYYESTISKLEASLQVPFTQICTDDLRQYLSNYERVNGSSKVTIDNIRRIFSSFFSWLEDEDYIVKSPARRIHHVKAPQLVKEVLSDEDLEALRDGCTCKRDLAIVDLLSSTGMRIGGIESRLRSLGRKLLAQRVHPHKFRRTLATNAIDKGMPIEQVQKLLGHARIDTTMHYALVNQSNVKASHRKYLE